MAKTMKFLILGFLVGVTIILSTVLMTLQVIFFRRQVFVKMKLEKRNQEQMLLKEKFSASTIQETLSTTTTITSATSQIESGISTTTGTIPSESKSPKVTPKDRIKTIRSSTAPNESTEYHLRMNRIAPHSTDIPTIADVHFEQALKLIPFESEVVAGGWGRNSHVLHGNAVPPKLLSRMKHRSRKMKKIHKKKLQNSFGGTTSSTADTSTSRNHYTNHPSSKQHSFAKRLHYILHTLHRKGFDYWWKIKKYFLRQDRVSATSSTTSRFHSFNPTDQHQVNSDPYRYTDSESNHLNTTMPTERYMQEKKALYHLQRAAQLGNHYAQAMVANSLASGILPVMNYPELRTMAVNQKDHGSNSSITRSVPLMVVPTDFAHGGEQLAQAILLWHMSAMQGNIEAAMALGYRSFYSATMGQGNSRNLDGSRASIITDEDVSFTLRKKHDRIQDGDQLSRGEESDTRIVDSNQRFMNQQAADPVKSTDFIASVGQMLSSSSSSSSPMTSSTPAKSPLTHSANPTAHYGILGTCESAMTYYEAAANAIMDELEASPLRGKVTPVVDQHNLAKIHMKGTSSALEYNDKPDESEEALQYYRMKASRRNPTPDVDAAYTLAQLHHYGIRGVRQDMAMALKYYEIAADFGHWEAAGQAGKFHLWSMGMEESERNLAKAYEYFKMGTQGGYAACRFRFEARADKKKKDIPSSMDSMGEDDPLAEQQDVTQCDHPSVNGMGLLHVFGVPGLVPINIPLAKNYFTLARDMGNMDASYNLGMLALGWLQSHQTSGRRRADQWNANKDGSGPSKTDFFYAMDCFTRAANMGHIQAKHRLAMMHSRGISFLHDTDPNRLFEVVPRNCQRALALYKEIAENGTTTSRRLQSAYKQYMAGNFESSLRNYLVAAETGSAIAQINAAFLMEQGHCLGLTRSECIRASLRLWRAAARQGSEEACLRVGDFFYYGRLRDDGDSGIIDAFTERTLMYSQSPFPWVRYLLYPEDLLAHIRKFYRSRWAKEDHGSNGTLSRNSCVVNNDLSEETCPALTAVPRPEVVPDFEQHLDIAAQYYRQAAEQRGSARANFNLGCMYEWGIGLKQDFPLAKRHYDLAGVAKSGEAALVVQLALFCMNIHEKVVKLKLFAETILRQKFERFHLTPLGA